MWTAGPRQVHTRYTYPDYSDFGGDPGGFGRAASETNPNADYPACRQAGPILGMVQQPAAAPHGQGRSRPRPAGASPAVADPL